MPEDYGIVDSGLLPVEGFLIDKIAETAVMPHEATDAAEPWASIVSLVSNLSNPCTISTVKGGPIPRIEALWRTLITNTYSRQHPAVVFCLWTTF